MLTAKSILIPTKMSKLTILKLSKVVADVVCIQEDKVGLTWIFKSSRQVYAVLDTALYDDYVNAVAVSCYLI